VARGRPEPGGVQRGLELADGAADEAGVLDPGVADLAQRRQRALEVDGQLVAQGVELDADLVGGTRCLPRPWPLASCWANAGPASAPEVPTTAAVVTVVRRKPRRLSRATSSRPAVSSWPVHMIGLLQRTTSRMYARIVHTVGSAT